jgi:hypothetical protein
MKPGIGFKKTSRVCKGGRKKIVPLGSEALTGKENDINRVIST